MAFFPTNVLWINSQKKDIYDKRQRPVVERFRDNSVTVAIVSILVERLCLRCGLLIDAKSRRSLNFSRAGQENRQEQVMN